MKYAFDFTKINSITKYPSILTYHQLGQKGRLQEDRIDTSIFADDEVVNLYEKIDGENSRIIFLGDGEEVDYLIGSREDLLFAKGDRIGNPSGNIAKYFEPLAEEMTIKLKGLKGLLVTYFESYGGKTRKSKEYTTDRTQYGRLFDLFFLDIDELEDLLKLPLDKIASWRDNGKQPFYDCDNRSEFVELYSLPTSPLLKTIQGSEMPKTIDETNLWLQQFSETKVGINTTGKSEGVIARSKNRSKITKIRFEDYERTIKFLARSK